MGKGMANSMKKACAYVQTALSAVAGGRDIGMLTHSAGAEHKEADGMSACIYQSELDFISRCILDCPRIETGGNLYGYWTVSGRPVIQYVLGPGRTANHQLAFFQQDNESLVKLNRCWAFR